MTRGTTLPGRSVAAVPPEAAAATTVRSHLHKRQLRPARGALASILLLALLLAAAGLAASCGGSSGTGADSAAGSAGGVTVFAAASLTEAFTQLGADFETAHPGATVILNFAGSQDLIAQLQQAAPADVLATADTASMSGVADLVGTPTVFAGNRLAIAVAPGNPEGISSLADLAKPGLKVVLAAPEVPAGKYASQVLKNAGVQVSPVSLEENVKGVVTKVSLGEADAGIVYATDVIAANGAIEGVEIPEDVNVVGEYPIATVRASARAGDAQAFVDLVLSAQGQKTLSSFGFLPPAP
jgi:molybdate transport system substrate-binding protein